MRTIDHLNARRKTFNGESAACGSLLFLGEDNPQSAAPEHALYPYPPGCAGQRFCSDILAVHTRTYLATWRTNLCNPTWKMREARKRAAALLSPTAPWSTIVMLGRKVAEAFSKLTDGVLGPMTFDVLDSLRITGVDDGSQKTFRIISLPHPSGRNLYWNNPRNKAIAREFLAERVPEYPWGEALESETP